MASTPPTKSSAGKEIKLNVKGEIDCWDSTWEDAELLRALILAGKFKGCGAASIRKQMPEFFGKYSTSALNGGLQTIRKSLKTQQEDRAKAAGAGCKYNTIFLASSINNC